MLYKRKELLDKLKLLKSICTTGVSDYTDKVLFYNKSIIAFNGKTGVVIEVLQEPVIKCVLSYKELLKVLSTIKKADVVLEFRGDGLLIETSSGATTLFAEQNIEVPAFLKEDCDHNSFKEFNFDFNTLKILQSCINKNLNMDVLKHIRITPDYTYTTDNTSICTIKHSCDLDVLLDPSTLSLASDLGCNLYKQNNTNLVLANEAGCTRIHTTTHVMQESFPDCVSMVQNHFANPTNTITVTEGLKEAVTQLSVIYSDDTVHKAVIIRSSNTLTISTLGKSSKTVYEQECSGPDFSITVNPQQLKKLLAVDADQLQVFDHAMGVVADNIGYYISAMEA